MYSDEYRDCLDYIDSYWDKIIRKPSGRTSSIMTAIRSIYRQKGHNYHLLEVPYAYITPNDGKFSYLFYWDSYFMFKGLSGTKRAWIIPETVKNFIYLFQKYGVIPNFNAPVGLGRSQPPLFTSMIIDAFITENAAGEGGHENNFSRKMDPAGKYWLKKAIDTAQDEYNTVWIDETNTYNHHVSGFLLSKYGDRDVGYAHSSELESGWDFTSRFYNRCNHFLPADLNTFLYKYETDFSRVAQFLGNSKDADYWQNKSEDRKKNINKMLWNEETGFYFDYDWFNNKQSTFLSLAGFVPLWAGLASAQQAKKTLGSLKYFASEYGLTVTAKESLAKNTDLTKIPPDYLQAVKNVIEPKQWDYPNIWAPLEYLTIIGLLRYGYTTEAERIMLKSVKAHSALFRKYKTFFEKINSLTGEPGTDFHYSNQTGFGWTNAIFYRYIQILDALQSGTPIYRQPQPAQPPYEIAIVI